MNLERATPGFRRGYWDAINDRGPSPLAPLVPGSFEAFDYQQGRDAALNELKWAKIRSQKKDATNG